MRKMGRKSIALCIACLFFNTVHSQAVWSPYRAASPLPSLAAEPPAQPISVTKADFDEDGIVDLAVGFRAGDGARIAIFRGNPDYLYPNSPAAKFRRQSGSAQPGPFFPPFTFAVEFSPTFLGAGDFDADGHNDLVIAHGYRIAWYRGDGAGRFEPAIDTALGGIVTALKIGDINRRDGLADVIVGATDASGSYILVLEGANGAMYAEPERISAMDAVADIVIGQLDDRYEIDFAMAAGRYLQVVSGRDRKTSLGPEARRAVLPASVATLQLPWVCSSIAIGDFVGDDRHRSEIAAASSEARQIQLLKQSAGVWNPAHSICPPGMPKKAKLAAARSTGSEFADLVVYGEGFPALLVVTGDGETVIVELEAPATVVVPMRLDADALNDLVAIASNGPVPFALMAHTAAVITVNSAADTPDGDVFDGICDTGNASVGFTGICTLRAAIQTANRSAGPDTINFSIGGGGQQTIAPATAYPALIGAYTFDGTTQPGYNGMPLIELDGVNIAAGSPRGLQLTSDSAVRGLCINRFRYAAITAANRNVFEANFIGTNSAGTLPKHNGTSGLGGIILFGSDNVVGGTASAARNLISGNKNAGVMIQSMGTASGNQIMGNYMGTDITGEISDPDGMPGNGDELSNTMGVYITGTNADNNTIGGTDPGARNVIAGSEFNYVRIRQGVGNLVQGNLMGTDKDGVSPLGCGFSGVYIFNTSNNTVGGSTAAARNVIAACGVYGMLIETASGILVQGNYIGTNSAGSLALGCAMDGIRFFAAPNNTVGGAVGGAGNVISGNQGNGVVIGPGGTTDVRALRNWIGSSPDGTTAVGNLLSGILIDSASASFIGSADPADRNLISGNGQHGVRIVGSTASGNEILGNYIGTHVDGAGRLANGANGVLVENAPNNLIGKTEAGNLISGNLGNGVQLLGSQATGNRIQGNIVGAQADMLGPLPNGLNGVLVQNAPNNQVGGATVAVRNILSGNAGNGVEIQGGQARLNRIEGNYIGVDGSGLGFLGNGGNGARVNGAPENTIGGDIAALRNVIAGNLQNGVLISGIDSSDNKVQGNFIGLGVDGATQMANTLSGVKLEDALGTIIGGSSSTLGAPPGNVVSGNRGHGIEVVGAQASNNEIAGNVIGAEATGMVAAANGKEGVFIMAAGTLVGGDSSSLRNLISGNGFNGVSVMGISAQNNKIKGNYIGVDATGNAPLSNGLDGVRFDAAGNGNSVGGEAANERNVISGNAENGIQIRGRGGVGVYGNYIGTNRLASAAVPNSQNGIRLFNTVSNAVYRLNGGPGNVISGNAMNGIEIDSDQDYPEGSMVNAVFGNNIGTDSSGTDAIGNGLNGILITGRSLFNTIGATSVAEADRPNTIAFNGRAGIVLPRTPDPNSSVINIVHSNGALGIDIMGDGVTPNDADDSDEILNFPIIDVAYISGINTIILGRLRTSADIATIVLTTYANSICDPSFHGEGRFPAAISTRTIEGGALNFKIVLSAANVPTGSILTMTTSKRHVLAPINFFWETSEFARCVTVIPGLLGDTNGDGCIDDVDLAVVLESFGQSGFDLLGDVDADGTVDDTDLAIVLEAFGNGC